MEELIKEAEGLYLELSRITESLMFARLHDDYDLLHGCRNELENFALSVMQTLKCLVDRKDNIVDLGEVWHGVEEEPDRTQDILIDSYTVGYYVPTTISFSDEKWSHCISNYAIKRWAYVKDLLPKGGEK